MRTFGLARVFCSLRLPLGGLVTIAAMGAAAGGCSKKSDDHAAASATPSSTPSSSAPSPTGAAAGPLGSAAAGAGGTVASTLADRLQREAQSRPAIQPNADDVLAAFAKSGGGVATKKQGLGATYKASFCEGGTTGDGALTMSVCEYPDEAAAKDGYSTIQTIYPAKQAAHVLHKDTVLTTLRLQDGPAAQALETKLIAVYKTL